MFLVTGGAGFIGSHLVDALLSKGEEVRVVDNLSSGKITNLQLKKNRLGLEFLEGDIRDYSFVEEAVKGVDGIYHQAAMVSVEKSIHAPMDSYSNNVQGTFNVFEAARKNKIKKIVFASSAAVYGPEYDYPVTENLLCKPISPYALDKYYAENLALVYFLMYGIKSIGLRYFNVYGSRQDDASPYSGVISIFISNITSGKVSIIQGDGTQTRDFIYVKDVVEANLAAMKTDIKKFESINVGTGAETSVSELLENICRITGNEFKYEVGESRNGDIKRSVSCIEKIKKILNWEPHYNLDRGLVEMNGE